MSATTQPHYYTEEQYLDNELHSEIKHEYINGEVYTMVGGTWAHSIISSNTAGEIRNHLKGKPCYSHGSEMKVKVGSQFFYPDALVECSENIENKRLFTESPTLIVEVLSDATRTYDQITKFSFYREIPTLEEYVLVEQSHMCVYIFRRSQNWHGEIYSIGEEVHFESIDFTLPIEELYADVKFEEIKPPEEE